MKTKTVFYAATRPSRITALDALLDAMPSSSSGGGMGLPAAEMCFYPEFLRPALRSGILARAFELGLETAPHEHEADDGYDFDCNYGARRSLVYDHRAADSPLQDALLHCWYLGCSARRARDRISAGAVSPPPVREPFVLLRLHHVAYATLGDVVFLVRPPADDLLGAIRFAWLHLGARG
jgi:hypothetical protein